MKRKVYTSARERKTDQLIGGGVFILVNIILWFAIVLLQRWPQTRSLSPPGNGQTTTLILWLGVLFIGLLISGGIWSLIKGLSWADNWWSSGDEPPGGTGA